MKDLLEQELIQVAHQQTRFLIAENDQTKEIDIRDLDIWVKTPLTSGEVTSATTKSKGKQVERSVEILSHAHLRIKTGVHYCFVARNGAGKSTVAQAIGRHLIPGLDSLQLRIACLDQTAQANHVHSQQTVLDAVVHSDPTRREVARKAGLLTAASLGCPIDLARAHRTLELEDAKRKLFMLEKLAKLRSRGIGFAVRATLREQETQVDSLAQRLESLSTDDDSINEEANAASCTLASLQAELEIMSLRDLESQARYVLRGLGFKDAMLEMDVNTLSGGWRMRCQLAASLIQPADLLILDEPTNNLDLLGILWLQEYLSKIKDDHPNRSVLIISHDRDFINVVGDELILLQEKQLVYFQGNLDSYDKSIYRERLRLTRMQAAQDRQVAHIKSSIADNIRQGKKNNDTGKLKQAKSRQKKLDERVGMEVSAKGTRFKLNRDLAGYYLTSRAAIELPYEEPDVHMAFPDPTALHPAGSLVSLENASLKYKKLPQPIISGVNMVVHPGDRIAVLGLNGAGKSTLVKLLTNALPASTGTITRHSRAKIGYYSQLSVEALLMRGEEHASLTALTLLMQTAQQESLTLEEQPARALLSGLGLKGPVASDTPVSKLSGGQVVRLALALLLLDPPHLLVLDEPTTHLDVYTVIAFAKALQEYAGAIVLVSHDRYFTRAVIEGDQIGDADSDEEAEPSDDRRDVERRRFIYEVSSGKVVLSQGGVDTYESSLEEKMTKLGLLSTV